MDQAEDGIVQTFSEPFRIFGREREFVGGAGDVRAEDEGVLRVDDGGFGRAGEEFVGMGGVPLVELIIARDEDGSSPLPRPSGSSHLLTQRRQGAGKTVENHGVETADIDAELECVGGRNA